MAEKMKHGNNAPVNTSSRNSSYLDCVCTILRLLSDFGEELNLGDDVLKIHLNTNAVDLVSSPAAHFYNSLQLHIFKLKAVSESLKTLVDMGVGSSSAPESTLGVGKENTVVLHSHKEEATAQPTHHTPIACVDISESKSPADDLIVQIRAGKSEIDRRIFAFMERKQMEINENNVREFCNVIDCNQENSCARTDAVFTPYPGFKSHVKVTRVVNTYGPQTRSGAGPEEAGEQMRGQTARNYAKPAIEERLHNIETHLKLNTGPVPTPVYNRLKKLEDRILELEGLSPEYFQSTSLPHKRPRTSTSQTCSLTELDGKISAVKAALRKRANQFGPGYGTECLF